ncbi:hypothetical protein HanIR_Chr01g0032231 [Helianthus annuus]|nr:hypothetical protein HanIR_Chr01g0032231 [Helianthus annuus]
MHQILKKTQNQITILETSHKVIKFMPKNTIAHSSSTSTHLGISTHTHLNQDSESYIQKKKKKTDNIKYQK